MSIANRTCLVTGASRGIGRGIAEEFGREGADVVVNYRGSEAEAYDAVADVEDVCGLVRFLASDEADYMTGQVLGVNGGMEW